MLLKVPGSLQGAQGAQKAWRASPEPLSHPAPSPAPLPAHRRCCSGTRAIGTS